VLVQNIELLGAYCTQVYTIHRKLQPIIIIYNNTRICNVHMQSVPITAEVASLIYTYTWQGVFDTTICDQICQLLAGF
jgi:hypothetical protein